MFFATLLWSTFLYSALVHPLGTFIAIQMTGAVVKRIWRDSENMNFEKNVAVLLFLLTSIRFDIAVGTGVVFYAKSG